LPDPRIALLLLVGTVLAACSPGRTVEAVGLLADVARAEPPAEIARRHVIYGADAVRRAHLYERPGARATLVLVPGAAEDGLEDPRLIGFAEALSRRGFRVLVPELAGEDALQVSAADADSVADAVRALPPEALPIGMAALSYAAGPTIIAAMEPDVRERVSFILSIGGYHDILESITYLTTGAFRDGPGAVWRAGPVDPRAKWIFLEANAVRVGNSADAARLRAIARTRLARQDTAGTEARLGPDGQRVLALFLNRDPDRVPALVAALPAAMRADIEALDLARRDLDALGARLILAHGRDDALVPYTESVALARRLGPGQARLHLLRNLQHVDLDAPGLGDALSLLRVAYSVLAERDAAAPEVGPISPESQEDEEET
jgi:pimeloyl-ACP methyl ester carboxylesterase